MKALDLHKKGYLKKKVDDYMAVYTANRSTMIRWINKKAPLDNPKEMEEWIINNRSPTKNRAFGKFNSPEIINKEDEVPPIEIIIENYDTIPIPKDPKAFELFIERVRNAEVEIHEAYMNAVDNKEKVQMQNLCVNWVKLSEVRLKLEAAYPEIQAAYGRFVPITVVTNSWSQSLSEMKSTLDQIPYLCAQYAGLDKDDMITKIKEEMDKIYTELSREIKYE